MIRKNVSREKGELRPFDEIRYFFYVGNGRACAKNATEIDRQGSLV
jgi:hypothetical protein